MWLFAMNLVFPQHRNPCAMNYNVPLSMVHYNVPLSQLSVVNKMVFPLSQVFLQHLPSLSQLQNFPELWLGILDFMDKFLHLDNSVVSLIAN